MMNEKGGCCGRRGMKAMQLQLGICIEIGGFNFILKSCEIMFLAPPAMQSPHPHVSIHCITLIYHLPHHVHTAALPAHRCVSHTRYSIHVEYHCFHDVDTPRATPRKHRGAPPHQCVSHTRYSTHVDYHCLHDKFASLLLHLLLQLANPAQNTTKKGNK